MIAFSSRIILTRPEVESGPWLQALQNHGFNPEVWPLIDIHPMPPEQQPAIVLAWHSLPECSAVLLVSPAAVNHFFALRPSNCNWPARTRAWCTGPGTGQALMSQGLAAGSIDLPPAATPWDTQHLWPEVKAQIQAGHQVFIVRGTQASNGAVSSFPERGVGRDWLAQQVRQLGAQIRWVVAYRRVCPKWCDNQKIKAHQAVSDHSVWLFSSALAVHHLDQLLPQQNWGRARALATHDRIALAAKELGFGRVQTCKPSSQEIIESLKSLA